MNVATQRSRVEEIPLDRLTALPLKLRPLDDGTVSGIAESMKSKGQQQDILVRRLDDGMLRVVYGEHRLAAARQAGMKVIRCRIESMSDAEELERKVVENIQRNERVNPVAEGEIFENLMLTKYRSISLLAESIGKPENYIRDRLALKRELSPRLQPFVGETLSISNAIQISKLATEEAQLITAESVMKAIPLNQGHPKNHGEKRQKHEKCVCPNCGDSHPKKRGDPF
jgi:ParB/RepB/Spo0J family partition protein